MEKRFGKKKERAKKANYEEPAPQTKLAGERNIQMEKSLTTSGLRVCGLFACVWLRKINSAHDLKNKNREIDLVCF